MGAVQSSSNNISNEETIREEMRKYAALWKHTGQTEAFRTHVPKTVTSFTSAFGNLGLNTIFTRDGLNTEIVFGNHNCLHLFRDTYDEITIPVYSDGDYIVLHALGEPGRDLGNDCGTKVSHLMILKDGDGPITFNEMLPSTEEEVHDFERRLEVGKKVYGNLHRNVPLSQCGEKVKEKAKLKA